MQIDFAEALRRRLDHVSLADFRDTYESSVTDTRRGVSLLDLIAGREWINRCTENYTADRIDTLGVSIQVDVSRTQRFDAALRIQPGCPWIPILVLPRAIGSPLRIADAATNNDAVKIAQSRVRGALAAAASHLILNHLDGLSDPKTPSRKDLAAVLTVALKDLIDPPDHNPDFQGPQARETSEILRDRRPRLQAAVAVLHNRAVEIADMAWFSVLVQLGRSSIIAVETRVEDSVRFVAEFAGLQMRFQSSNPLAPLARPLFGQIDVAVPTLYCGSHMNHHTRIFVPDGVSIARPAEDGAGPFPAVRLYGDLYEQQQAIASLDGLCTEMEQLVDYQRTSTPALARRIARARGILGIAVDDLADLIPIIHEHRYAVKLLTPKEKGRPDRPWVEDNPELEGEISKIFQQLAPRLSVPDAEFKAQSATVLADARKALALLKDRTLGRQARAMESGPRVAHYWTKQSSHSTHLASATGASTGVRLLSNSAQGVLLLITAMAALMCVYVRGMLGGETGFFSELFFDGSGWPLYLRQSVAALLALGPSLLLARLAPSLSSSLAERIDVSRVLALAVAPILQVSAALLILARQEQHDLYGYVLWLQFAVVLGILADMARRRSPLRRLSKRIRDRQKPDADEAIEDATSADHRNPPRRTKVGKWWDGYATNRRWRMALRPVRVASLVPLDLSSLEDASRRRELGDAMLHLRNPHMPAIKILQTDDGTPLGSTASWDLVDPSADASDPADQPRPALLEMAALGAVAGAGVATTVAESNAAAAPSEAGSGTDAPSSGSGSLLGAIGISQDGYSQAALLLEQGTPGSQALPATRWGRVNDGGRLVELRLGVDQGGKDLTEVAMEALALAAEAKIPVVLLHAPSAEPNLPGLPDLRSVRWLRLRLALPSTNHADAFTLLRTYLARLDAIQPEVRLSIVQISGPQDLHRLYGQSPGFGRPFIREDVRPPRILVAVATPAVIGAMHRSIDAIVHAIDTPDMAISTLSATVIAGQTVVLAFCDPGADEALPQSEGLEDGIKKAMARKGLTTSVVRVELGRSASPQHTASKRDDFLRIELRWHAPDLPGLARQLIAELRTQFEAIGDEGAGGTVTVTYLVTRVVDGYTCRGRLLARLDHPAELSPERQEQIQAAIEVAIRDRLPNAPDASVMLDLFVGAG